MTRKEIAKKLFELKKGKLPNVIGRNSPLDEKEFVDRYLNGCGCVRGFKKAELEMLLEREMERANG